MTLTGDANIDVAMSGEISPAVYPNAVDVHHGGGVEDFDNHISAEFLGVFGTPDEKPGGIGRASGISTTGTSSSSRYTFAVPDWKYSSSA